MFNSKQYLHNVQSLFWTGLSLQWVVRQSTSFGWLRGITSGICSWRHLTLRSVSVSHTAETPVNTFTAYQIWIHTQVSNTHKLTMHLTHSTTAWIISVNIWGLCKSTMCCVISVEEMINRPFETRSDSFYFANNTLIMHHKAEYSFSQGLELSEIQT